MTHSRLRLVGKDTKNRGSQNSDSRSHTETCQYVEVLFRKYRDPLKNYLTRLSGSPDDALELLQETYIRLLEQENLDHIETNARAYLFKIATNLVLDKSRKDKARQRDKHQPFLDGVHLDEAPSAAAHVNWSKALESLKDVLKEFSPRCRRVFILHHFRNMAYNEIADLLGVTTRTVERDMSLAMTLCREKLKGII